MKKNEFSVMLLNVRHVIPRKKSPSLSDSDRNQNIAASALPDLNQGSAKGNVYGFGNALHFYLNNSYIYKVTIFMILSIHQIRTDEY